jgi:hypothetical protein
MHSRAMSKWTIELFLCIVVIVAGMIIVLVAIPGIFIPKVCPVGQAEEIQKIVNKVNEIKGRPGYEVVYFEVKKECVEYIESGVNILNVKYKTVNDTIKYPIDKPNYEFDWNIGTLKPGNYPLRVFADRVES